MPTNRFRMPRRLTIFRLTSGRGGDLVALMDSFYIRVEEPILT